MNLELVFQYPGIENKGLINPIPTSRGTCRD